MTDKEFISLWNKTIRSMNNEARRDILRLIGNQAVRMFKENFRREGFFGSKWKEVRRRKYPHGKKADSRRPILTQTGNLGRSVQASAPQGDSIFIGSDLPYAGVHNYGGRAGRGRKTVIPKRQFIGDHKRLNDAICTIMHKQIMKLFNQ